MLKCDIIWPPHRQYTSNSDWEPVGFFSDNLCNARQFDLMLGFFSSSAIEVLCYGFSAFIYNGGKMRLIINELLSREDINAIEKGVCHNIQSTFDLNDLSLLKSILSKRDQHFFDCLSYLISEGRVDIKIIRPKVGEGISHTKIGVFNDGINKIAFSGSCNFSYTALVENIEHLSAECDWDGSVALAKIRNIEYQFNKVFNEEDNNIEYISASELSKQISNTFEKKSVHELLRQEMDLITSTDSTQRRSVIEALSKTKELVESYIKQFNSVYNTQELLLSQDPQFPYPTGPRDYQTQAFLNWRKNNQRGLFAMATGTGKTITALNCLLEIYKRFGYYKALILVPTVTLVDQWETECLKFNFTNIITVCSKNHGWIDDISNLRFQERFQGKGNKLSYVIIATYTSFSKENTFGPLCEFSRNQLLFIADEVHNMGANNIKKLLHKIPYMRRLGLSATPERQFDEFGNKSIQSFFGIEDCNYTFDYPMKLAIDNGVLCKYFYYPHIVELNDDEMNDYIELSTKIAKYFSIIDDCFIDKDPILTGLLLKRKRIIHKAVNKIEVFRNILKDRLQEKGNLKYTLIYVPEGNKPDDEDADFYIYTDSMRDDETSLHLIDVYSKIVCECSPSVTVRKFTSATSEREKILADFANGKIDVLTSMKCLDEGIDVPRSELAIFCASTGNPRQFIQRRGRILRTHKDKPFAIIHDLIITPKVNVGSESFDMEKSLLRKELLRVRDFALLSENPSHTCMVLNEIMDYYGLTLFNNE